MVTGGEVPAANAVTKAVKAVAGEDATVKQQLGQMAKDSPAMRAAAESYAKRLAIKQAVLLKLYAPLAKWVGQQATYFEDEFSQDMATKIDGIPDEELVSPRPSVAVPAMQGLAYSLDEPSLKEMYLNLLATATDRRRCEGAHPAYADIIKQLSSAEAHLLRVFLDGRDHSIVRMRRHPIGSPDEHYHIVIENLVNLTHQETGELVELPSARTWIDNWVRLGLVDVSYAYLMSDPAGYAWVDKRPEVIRLRENLPDIEAVTHIPGVMRRTGFGQGFAAAVGIVDHVGEGDSASPST